MYLKLLPDGPTIGSIHTYEYPILVFSSKSGFQRQYKKLLHCGWTVVDPHKWVMECPPGTMFRAINGYRYYENQIIEHTEPLLRQYWQVPPNHQIRRWILTRGMNYRNPDDPRNGDLMGFAERYAHENHFPRR